MAFRDGLSDFLTTWNGVHTAYSFNNTAVNSGTNAIASAGSSSYATNDTDNYPNAGVSNRCNPTTNGNFDNFIVTDVCMLLHLPSSGFTINQNYGLFHNGGGTHAQAGWCRYDSVNGWEICISHNQSGSNQDETYYTIGDNFGWVCIGFQFEDNLGNMALWVNGINVSEVSRVYEMRFGSGNPRIGGSNADHPILWGAESDINGSGILIANMVIDNPNLDNTNPAGNGDTFYSDYYDEHFIIEVSTVNKIKFNGLDLNAKYNGVTIEKAYHNGVLILDTTS